MKFELDDDEQTNLSQRINEKDISGHGSGKNYQLNE